MNIYNENVKLENWKKSLQERKEDFEKIIEKT